MVSAIHRSLVRIQLKGLFCSFDFLKIFFSMEEQEASSIPPGVVPSESKEDLYRKLCYEDNEGDTNLLKEVSTEKMC